MAPNSENCTSPTAGSFNNPNGSNSTFEGHGEGTTPPTPSCVTSSNGLVAWYPITGSTVQDVLGVGAGGALTGSGVSFTTDKHGNANAALSFTGASGTYVNVASDSSSPTGAAARTRHPAVVTYGGTNIVSYMDATTTNMPAGALSLTTTGTSMVVGAAIDTANEWLNGQIDDIRVYSRVLAASEVSCLTTAGPQ